MERQTNNIEGISVTLDYIYSLICESNTLSPSLIWKTLQLREGLKRVVRDLDTEHFKQIHACLDMLADIYYHSYFNHENYPRITTLEVYNILYKLNQVIFYAIDKNRRAGEMAKALKYILETLLCFDREFSDRQRLDREVMIDSFIAMYPVNLVKVYPEQVENFKRDARERYSLIKKIRERYFELSKPSLTDLGLETDSDETADYMPTAGLESTMDALPNNPDLIESRDVAEA